MEMQDFINMIVLSIQHWKKEQKCMRFLRTAIFFGLFFVAPASLSTFVLGADKRAVKLCDFFS